MLSSLVAVFAASHHNWARFCFVNPAKFIIALPLPISVGRARSTTPFCCGVPGAVNSNVIPRFSSSHISFNFLFSPELSHLIHSTLILCTVFRFLNHLIRTAHWSDFFFRKKLCLYLVASSTTNTQCLFPPKLRIFMDEISRYNRFPGLLVFSLFSLGTFFWRIFSIMQFSHLSNFPVNWIPNFFAVASPSSFPQCPSSSCHLLRATFAPLIVAVFASLKHRIIFAPIRTESPLLITWSSLKPLCFSWLIATLIVDLDLLFSVDNDHPSIIIVVKLRRLWPSSGTTLTFSNVNLTSFPSFCLISKSSLPRCVIRTPFPSPTITWLFTGIRSYIPRESYVIWLVAAVSPNQTSLSSLS